MNTQFSLQGKTALVTGASSGLGVQFAKALAGQGANIAILARRKDRLEQVAKEIKAIGVDCHPIVADVTREDDVIAAVAKTVDHCGRIDILVNNAGLTTTVPAERMSLQEWHTVIDTNLTGLFIVAREVGKQMIRQRYGKIINIGSMFGAVGFSTFPIANYSASKAAVDGLTRQLAIEWASHNINVNAIGPGFFESEMTSGAFEMPEFKRLIESKCPMQRTGRAGELDGIAIFLASDASSYITGQTIYVDGGWTVV